MASTVEISQALPQRLPHEPEAERAREARWVPKGGRSLRESVASGDWVG